MEEYRDGNAEAIARIVATGEEVATAFLTLELDRFGIPAQVLDPSQIQLIADTSSNDTEPVSADLTAIESVLAQGRVAVIPGFVARDRQGRVALFGRGGSDLSALFLAKQLNARCRLVKDVDGIYNSDPATAPMPSASTRSISPMRSPSRARSYSAKPSRSARRHRCRSRWPLSAKTTQPSSAAIAPCWRPRSFTPAPLKVGPARTGHGWPWECFRSSGSIHNLFDVTGIAVRRPELHLDHAPSNLLTRDCWDVIDDVDVVVELIGGSDPAGELVNAALAAGKPVVTANKLLLAGDAQLETHRDLRYSAAVGGAVPALEAVRALADDDQIVSLSGVLNGTCNYILDRIAAGCSWEQAVAEAQAARLRRSRSQRRSLGIRHGLQAAVAGASRLSANDTALRQFHRN